ncbi:DsbE family thiol:disulfide interchange protein [Candidatus Pelagibacter communis]|uniref:DsbE family thiol:disulfide interchange protein n=1 Tax=Pelagibacter ubique TaxID=198252 RepID=UPI00094CE111|nr:DsbE family thiol:disulfide interchange protein [Candidatus Pelagibacter ubique]|tara:strand:- start:1210 stop:1734 length:525 start_codon:yes stop_codon:yes gene_type:complete
MKNNIAKLLIIFSLILLFIIFYKSLNKSNLYQPKSNIKFIPSFSAITFFSKEELNSEKIFYENKFYLFNIWASWCLPCVDEHPFLIELSKNSQLEIIGLNYKDNFENAKKFLDELGNPFKKILIDRDGTKAIEWGAYGVPENFLIYENKIVKRFIGPLDGITVDEIKKIINENY